MDLEIPIKCPKCKKDFKQHIQTLKRGKSLTCKNPFCKVIFTISDDSFEKIQKSLEAMLKNLPKKFDIKL